MGTYGTLGIPSASNTPGGRVAPFTFTDLSGNFWLFGGNGMAGIFQTGDLNDLWKYSGGQWTWMGGSTSTEAKGVYGTRGIAAPGNWPGARWIGASWTDNAGNFWIFGGAGIDSAGTRGDLNDLWEYSNGEWAWMGGPNTAYEPGTTTAAGAYGTKGVPSPNNLPGPRWDAMSWADSSGSLWLFGGEGNDINGNTGVLNDLWKYSNGEWTWMNGSNVVNQTGAYGSLRTASSANVPGARTDGVTWIDKAGNLWLFGGQGYDSTGTCTKSPCVLNDLWKYSNGAWTWMDGSNLIDAPGTYGTQGISGSKNAPGARSQAVSWIDAADNLWLFGGVGLDSMGNYGDLNDLWKYSGGQWTWMPGSSEIAQLGIYGTQGKSSANNVPGARAWAVGWTDKAGNFWLFGGEDIFSAGGSDATSSFNDLWEYKP
jgi:N-acetylneuraminic acid mutarotase